MFDPDWERVKVLAGMKDDNCPECGGQIILDGGSLDIAYIMCRNPNCHWSFSFNPLTIWGTAGYLELDENGFHEPKDD